MPAFRMRLSAPSQMNQQEAARTLLWDNSGRSSFTTGLGPGLGRLGPVPRPNIELVRLAAAVLGADRSTRRAKDGSNWSRRSIELTVPVFDPDPWTAASERLAALLGFLSGDEWDLMFVRARTPKETVATRPDRVERVVLLSGGADSAIGALLAAIQHHAQPHAVVSHLGATNLSPIQKDIARRVATLAGLERPHLQLRLTRASRRVDGTRFPNEYSTRTRSLLFVSLGLAVASLDEAELWIPENGFASLNPPLTADQRGSLSTRTTHPTFLGGLNELLPEIGVHARISNPCAAMTKGEMYSFAASHLGTGPAAELLSATHSCGHTGHRSFGHAVRVQCGVCFGCLVRRSAFRSSGLTDTTQYLDASSDPRVRRYLEHKSMEAPTSVFIERGVNVADIAAMSLPASYPGREALDLCERTISELQTLWP
jgi:7-cyano-7-deazaguanine synthase in queuosine biosynthesis